MEYSRLKRSILGVYLVLSEPFPGARRRCALAQGRTPRVARTYGVAAPSCGGSASRWIPSSGLSCWRWWGALLAAIFMRRPLSLRSRESEPHGKLVLVVCAPANHSNDLVRDLLLRRRGGFLLLARSAEDITISPFGVGALSGLVGMFSKQATDKLREVFDNLFKTGRGKGTRREAGSLRTGSRGRSCCLQTGPFFFSFGKVNRRTSSPSGSCTI